MYYIFISVFNDIYLYSSFSFVFFLAQIFSDTILMFIIYTIIHHNWGCVIWAFIYYLTYKHHIWGYDLVYCCFYKPVSLDVTLKGLVINNIKHACGNKHTLSVDTYREVTIITWQVDHFIQTREILELLLYPTSFFLL